MKLIRLSLQNIFFKPLNLALSLALFALGIGLISLMFILNKQITQQFENNLAGIDLIIGAKGSPLQLVLNGLYHIDAPTGNISLKAAAPFMNPKHPLIKKAVPLSLGDSYKGFRIVGTNMEFPNLYKAVLSRGTWWAKPMEVVIGSSIAEIQKLKVGDTFISSHGLTTDELNQHDRAPYLVSGVLKSTGSVCDQLVLTSPESIWQVHEHQRSSTDTTGRQDSIYMANREITTLLIQYKSKTNIASLNLQRTINQNTQLQAATPALEINRLFSMMGIGFDAIRILAWVIAFVSGLSIFISLYNSLNERRPELALMRVMGATPASLFSLILLEGLLVAILGFVLGLLVSHLVLQFSSEAIFNMYKYRISPWHFIQEEAWLLGGALGIGCIAAVVPAFQAYRTEIAQGLK